MGYSKYVGSLSGGGGGGGGDVSGPASSTDNALARFDGTTGKLIQNSVGILSNTGALSGLTGLLSSGTITFSGLTASRALTTGASSELAVSATTATELGYVSGVTSSIQTQLDAKATSTLADGSIFIGNGSNVATAQAVTGDISISNAGVTAIATGVIVNADVNASAAIAYSKLNLSDSIVNADVNSAAAIAGTKISPNFGAQNIETTGTIGASNFSGSSSGTNTGDQTITLTGDVTGSGTGSFATSIAAGVIVNADVNASAAIAVSKLAALTASRAVVSDGSGFLSAATTTATEIGYVNGVTSSIQTQLDTIADNRQILVSAKSADYTVLDDDGIRTVLMTTGATDKTVTLPTASANTNRIITIKKVDSGTGSCIVDGEGAETIDGATTQTVFFEEDSITVQCDGTGWHILSRKGVEDYVELDLSSDATFTAGTAVFRKKAGIVTCVLTQTATFSSSTNPISSAGFVPAAFRPTTSSARNSYSTDQLLRIRTTGEFEFSFDSAETSAAQAVITYTVD